MMISCLMVTLPVEGRLASVRQSLRAYLRQTHAERELLVVLSGGDEACAQALQNELADYATMGVRCEYVPGDLPLGALRNISLDKARGDIVCQWDDDDVYHSQRLEAQLAHLMSGGYDAVYLQDVFQYFPQRNALYWTNWRATEVGAHPGTLMLKREVGVRYPSSGPHARLSEDLQVALELKRDWKVGAIEQQPHLFVYVSHGGNSWSMDHHENLAAQLGISRGLLARREVQIREGLKGVDLSLGGTELMGNNGAAFTL